MAKHSIDLSCALLQIKKGSNNHSVEVLLPNNQKLIISVSASNSDGSTIDARTIIQLEKLDEEDGAWTSDPFGCPGRSAITFPVVVTS